MSSGIRPWENGLKDNFMHKVEVEKVEVAAEGEDCETEAAVAAQPVLAQYVLQYKAHVEK